MRQSVSIGVLALFVFCGIHGDVESQTLNTFLNGKQEVPPVATNATSYAVFGFLLDDTLMWGYRFNFDHDQTVTGVHVHEGAPGQDGPIVINLRPDAVCVDLGSFLTIYFATRDHLRGPLAGKTLADLKELMTNGQTYLNLHTEPFPDGWIRGQFGENPNR